MDRPNVFATSGIDQGQGPHDPVLPTSSSDRIDPTLPGFEAIESGSNPGQCSGHRPSATRHFDPIGILTTPDRDIGFPQRRRGWPNRPAKIPVRYNDRPPCAALVQKMLRMILQNGAILGQMWVTLAFDGFHAGLWGQWGKPPFGPVGFRTDTF